MIEDGEIKPEQPNMEPVSPSVWRSTKRNTTRNVSTLAIAKNLFVASTSQLMRCRLQLAVEL
jgi:hypothetical protein